MVVLLAALLISYAGDWLVYRYRLAHGTALGSVKVNQFLAVPLKDGKYELDWTGSQQVECARAIFPRGSDDPCWWLKRHADQWTKP